ncbi:hypothetical protein A2U01_0061951, partial [Trifolium medium]|nr:hypothetical protein [Trifolium medium]
EIAVEKGAAENPNSCFLLSLALVSLFLLESC